MGLSEMLVRNAQPQPRLNKHLNSGSKQPLRLALLEACRARCAELTACACCKHTDGGSG